MHTMHFDLWGEKFHQLKWKALIKSFSSLLDIGEEEDWLSNVQVWSQHYLLSNFPGFEIEILSGLTLAG